jgi:hypothetical protein
MFLELTMADDLFHPGADFVRYVSDYGENHESGENTEGAPQ